MSGADCALHAELDPTIVSAARERILDWNRFFMLKRATSTALGLFPGELLPAGSLSILDLAGLRIVSGLGLIELLTYLSAFLLEGLGECT